MLPERKGGEGGVRVPPGSTVRILDAEAGRAPKGGEGSYFRSEGGGEGLFQGAKPPPNSYRFRCLFGPGSDFGSGFGAYPGAPSTVGRGSEQGTDCPPYRRYRGEGGGETGPDFTPLVSLPWRRAANPAPNVPSVFTTVGSGPDCTAGAFGPRKGGYPLSHVPYSKRRTGTSPRPRGPPVHPPRLPARPALPPRAPCGRVGLGPLHGLERYPGNPPPPLGPPSDPRERFLGYPRGFPRFKWNLFCIRGESRASEAFPDPSDPPYMERAPKKRPQPKCTRQGTRPHTPMQTKTHEMHTKNRVSEQAGRAQHTRRTRGAHAAHTKPPCMVRGLHTARRAVANPWLRIPWEVDAR